MPMLNFTAPQINEKQLEEELATMTEHEKEEQYRDLYGQEKDLNLDLTPELIDELLAKTTTEIRGMRLKNGYKIAMEKCPDVVLDRDFQLEFLESVQYDPKVSMPFLARLDRPMFGSCMLIPTPCSLQQRRLYTIGTQRRKSLALGICSPSLRFR